MRITNLLHFTENHRFTVYRNFSLGPLDYKMLHSVYQPMIGSLAVSLYHVLYQQLTSDQAGFSPLEQQRKLFLAIDLDPGENGRRQFIEQTSKLEAVGLLHTFRKIAELSDDDIFEYQLQPVLPPDEFLLNTHLVMLLRDKIGKHALIHLSRELIEMEPQELIGVQEEVLTVPFYELFRLNAYSIDPELEQAFYEMAPTRNPTPSVQLADEGFQYADIITRFPKASHNRAYVEALQHKPNELARVNFIAKKYDLQLIELCRLLDEDGIFTNQGNLLVDAIQHKANLMFRQTQKREDERVSQLARAEAVYLERTGTGEKEYKDEKTVDASYYLEVPALFAGQCEVDQYNMLLRNEPYTAVLKLFFQNGRVPDGIQNAFEKIDLQYKLNEEVINVIIHYLHIDRRSWSRASIDYVAADMMGKQVTTYEQAVQYIREQLAYKERVASGKKGKPAATSSAGPSRGTTKKPSIPIIQHVEDAPLSQEEFEEIRRKAQILDSTRQ